jgi:hypothetical protein
LSLAISDPRSRPNWRHERVAKLISAGIPPNPRRDDDRVTRMRKMYMDRNRLLSQGIEEEVVEDTLAGRYKDLWQADRIYAGGRSDRLRYGLEAMLLARVPLARIALSTNCSEYAVRLYSDIFFDVLDKLDSKAYVASVVLRDAFMSGLNNRSNELAAKYFGYFGGPLVLDAILDAFDGVTANPTDGPGLVDWIDENYMLKLKVQSLVGATFMQPNNYNIRSLFESYQGLLSLSVRQNSDSGSENVVSKAVDIFLGMCSSPLGNEADKLLAADSAKYSNLQITPRVSQRAAMSRGEVIDVVQKVTSPTWSSPSERPKNFEEK